MPFTSVPLTFTPAVDAIGGSVAMTALVGVIPLLAFFVLLGAFKVKTHWCSIISLVLAALIAYFGFGMPVTMIGCQPPRDWL